MILFLAEGCRYSVTRNRLLTSTHYKYVFWKTKGKKETAIHSFINSSSGKKIKITCHLVREGVLFRKQYMTNEIETSKLTS